MTARDADGKLLLFPRPDAVERPPSRWTGTYGG